MNATEMHEPPAPAAVKPQQPAPSGAIFAPLRLLRLAIAGVLMGIANLIPGVSGGTMILAMGIYQEFIDSVAAITRFRFTLRAIFFLAVVGAFAAGAIVGLAGVILHLLFHYPIGMFSLFIGLTLGGAPLLYRRLQPLRADAVIAICVGFGLMVAVFFLKQDGGWPTNTLMDFVSGIVGATTMVLPGVSGSYMLMVMGQYERVISAVDEFKAGLLAVNWPVMQAALAIIVPVGVGAMLGIIGLSNLLKLLLHRFARPTIGVLLGILLGSVVGLWPFGKPPGEKALERRQLVELYNFVERWEIPGVAALPADLNPDLIEEAERDRMSEALGIAILREWPNRGRSGYSWDRYALALAAVVAGFCITFALSRGQVDEESPRRT